MPDLLISCFVLIMENNLCLFKPFLLFKPFISSVSEYIPSEGKPENKI